MSDALTGPAADEALLAKLNLATESSRRDWPVMLAAAFLALVAATAVLAPVLAPFSPEYGALSAKLVPPSWLEGGRPEYLLGTDLLGRDILSRLIYGARVSITVSLLAVVVAGVMGATIGLLAGYFRGKVDAVLMAMTDVVFSMPLILMAIVLVALIGASFANVLLVIVVLLWPYYARQVRAETLALRENEFVALARISGCGPLRIMWRHILPNLMPTLLVLGTMQVATVILLEASLSFLGVGIPPPIPAWGLMVADGRDILVRAWWVSFWPGLTISLMVLAVAIVGDWIRDRLDPRLRDMRDI
jgi:peptide/nickel transport system permease protein